MSGHKVLPHNSPNALRPKGCKKCEVENEYAIADTKKVKLGKKLLFFIVLIEIIIR